jgi:hypothetical protein
MTSTTSKSVFALTLLCASNIAAAQWQWKDDNGRMVYSDRPPPTNISPSQMVKAPAPKPVAKPDAKGDAAKNDPVAVAAANLKAGLPAQPAAKQSIADKDLESKKKALEAEQAEKKRATDSERDARNMAACEDTRASIRTMDSGVRVSQTKANGEREYMSDEARAKKTADLKRDLADNCAKKG